MADARRPFVDRPMVDTALADRVASTAAAHWSLPAPAPMRRGMNALYAAGDAVIRIGQATADPALLHALVDVMSSHGVPTLTPLRGASMVVDGVAATGWHRIRNVERSIDWVAVGRAVRDVHRVATTSIPEGFPLPSPTSFPWWQFDDMLAEVRGEVDAPAFDGLAAVVDRAAGWRDAIADGTVLCHGDVHPGNVLMSSRGALLVDWDLMAVANPAWDHAMLTTYAVRWGGDEGVYERFAAGYGRSLADDELTNTLAELRNVAATLMRVKAGRSDEAARLEAGRRLRYWRGDAAAPVWRAQ